MADKSGWKNDVSTSLILLVFIYLQMCFLTLAVPKKHWQVYKILIPESYTIFITFGDKDILRLFLNNFKWAFVLWPFLDTPQNIFKLSEYAFN
jgi:hypothetical protein